MEVTIESTPTKFFKDIESCDLFVHDNRVFFKCDPEDLVTAVELGGCGCDFSADEEVLPVTKITVHTQPTV
jgi:hypothetical protein